MKRTRQNPLTFPTVTLTRRWTVRLLWMAGMTAASLGRGATFLEEPFGYPDGPLVGAAASPWVAHSQAGNGPVSVISGSMRILSGQAEDINAPLAGGPFETDGLTEALYVRFKIRCLELPTETGAYVAHLRSGTAARARVWISTANAAEGAYRLGIGNSVGADTASGQIPEDLEMGREYAVVARYDLATGRSAIGLDPTLASEVAVEAMDEPGPTAIGAFAFRQAAGGGEVAVDDLLISDAFPGEIPDTVRLSVRLESEGLRLSWPDWATNHVLQRTANLEAIEWEDEATAVEREGAERVVRIGGLGAAENRSGYFRLRPILP